MAGTPSFTRSKRYHHYHTSHETTFDGSEVVNPTTSLTLHPVTNLTASPDGTFHVKADTDFNDKALTGVQDGNVLHFRKVTVTHTDLTATAPGTIASQDVELFDMPAGGVVTDMTANLITPFWGSGVASINRIKVGDLSDSDGFGISHLVGSSESTGVFYENWGTTAGVGTDKGAFLMNASVRKNKIYATATSLQCKVIASPTCYLASLTHGEVDLYFLVAHSE